LAIPAAGRAGGSAFHKRGLTQQAGGDFLLRKINTAEKLHPDSIWQNFFGWLKC
jgi:hypothetical protein